MSTPLSDIVSLLDTTLRIRDIKDASVAMNGLQVENNGCVTKVALLVQEFIRRVAAEERCALSVIDPKANAE